MDRDRGEREGGTHGTRHTTHMMLRKKSAIKSSNSESSNSQLSKELGSNNNNNGHGNLNNGTSNMHDSALHLRSKLVKCMFSHKWKRVRQILKTKGAIEQVKSFDSYKGVTILSMACSLNPPVDVIKALLSIEPLHSLQVDSYGMLPLHIACMNGASSDAIEVLLNHDEGACVQAIDMFKRTPLHYAAQYVCEPGGIVHGESLSSTLSETPQQQQQQEQQLNSCTSIANRIYSNVGHGTATTMREKRNIPGSALLPFAQAGAKSRKSSSHASQLTMTQEGFQDQIRVIQLLSEAGPEIVMHADRDGRTPIDILQDCKAVAKEGSKWERADIVCEFLRNVAIRVYREQKIVAEIQGYRPIEVAHAVAFPSSQASTSTSYNSYVSGASNLSKMEIDCTSYNGMDVSVTGGEGVMMGGGMMTLKEDFVTNYDEQGGLLENGSARNMDIDKGYNHMKRGPRGIIGGNTNFQGKQLSEVQEEVLQQYHPEENMDVDMQSI